MGVECGLTDPCDPDATGRTCEEAVREATVDQIGTTIPVGCDLVPHREDSCFGDPAAPEVIDVDVDAVDVVDGARDLLDHGDCYAVSSTEKVESGSSPTGFGILGSGGAACEKPNGEPAQHNSFSLVVCIKYRAVPGGVWKDGPCETNVEPDSPYVSEETHMPCLDGTFKYRTRVEGFAVNDQGQLIHNPRNGGWMDVEKETCHSSDRLPAVRYPGI